MTLTPPQGADPVREAAQALIDRYYSSTLWVDMIDEARALRTALAAPEGPAPTPWISVTDRLPEPNERVDVWMAVHASPRSMGLADDFRVPESWQRDGRWFHSHNFAEKELDASYITHWMPMPRSPGPAPEAPPPAEARQHDRLEALTRMFQALILADVPYVHSDHKEGWHGLYRAALAAPAGAIQPHLDHQVGAPVTLSDAANPWCWYCGSSEPTCQKPFDDVPCRRSKQGNGGGL